MKRIPAFKYLFGIGDITVIYTSFMISMFLLRNNKSLNFFEFNVQALPYSLIFFGLSLAFLVIFQYNGLYRVNVLITRALHLSNIFKALYYGALNVILISLLIENSRIIDSRYLIFLFAFIGVPLIYLVRVELLRYLFIRFSHSGFRRDAIILGDGRSGKLLATKLMYENPIGLNIIGFVDADKPIGTEIVIGKKVIGHFTELDDIMRRYSVDELLIAVDDSENENVLALIDKCKEYDVNIRVSSELFHIVAERLVTEKYADIPVIDVTAHYNNLITIMMKRIFDLVLASFALIVLSPVMLFIALMVKLSSPGPILFKQARIGRYGKEFNIYKFRSMKVINGEDEDRKKEMLNFMNNNSGNIGAKIINNSRVTWIGNIIRKTSLDELPQFFNVLKGEMSLVGPRPCLPYEFENYDEWQKRRVSVIPGCTGVWQVWGRSSVSYNESVVLDLYYINNMSPWFDLQLIFQTIPAMLTARGAK